MATNDELLRIWAQQNGSDYNVLAGSQNGGNTGSSQNAANDLYAEYGFTPGTLPGTSVPAATPTQTSPTTPASTQQPTATNPYPYMQDYIDYYTAIGQQPDKSYDEWVSWRNSGGAQQPTTPTTTPSATPTPTQTTGTSPQDYINYYTSRGITQPPIGYEAWVQMMQGGGDTTPTGGDTSGTTGGQTGTGTGTTGGQTGTGTGTTGGQTQGTSVQDYITYWTSRGVTTPPMGYDEWVTFITNGGGTTTPGTTGAGGTGTSGGSVTHNYPTVDMDNRQRISDMYDAQINAERAALQEQGDQALSDAQANRDNIAKLYNQQRNAASVEWERQRRNFLEGAASSGLNTGAGSQAELSMMSMAQREQNNLGAAQAGAEAEADRNMADIRRSTQAAINEAVMKNDYQKAAALLDEYNEQYKRAMDRAEALAQYGDFSGYAAIYGNEAAAQMRYTWIMSNPEIALAMGQITQQQYAQLALYKQYPALALSGGYGGSGGSSGGGDYSGGTSSWTGGAVYTMGELIDAAAAGMTRAQIEQALTERGIDVTQPTVQADITTALSK